MKTIFPRSLALLLLLACLELSKAADNLTETFQRGLLEEEANHNLPAAIEAYQSVLKQLDQQRKIAATTVFRLGECYRKLGKTNEATAQFQRVVREFSDQTVLVNLSQQNLAGLGVEKPSGKTRPDLIEMLKPDEETTEIEKLKKLLQDSPDLINARVGGVFPLHKAVSNGWLRVAKFLLEHGADISKTERNTGRTALHIAVGNGHKSITELLLNSNADINARSGNDWTPLHVAASGGFKVVAELLLSRKADVHAQDRYIGPFNSGPALQSAGTPLHHAAWVNHAAVTRLLLSSGAEVDARSQFGLTPLHLAAGRGHLSAAEALIESNADLNARIASRLTERGRGPLALEMSVEGCAPLHLAALHGDKPMAELLLSKGANANEKSSNHNAPLNIACMNMDVELVELLLKHGADVNVRGEHGWPPLYTAAERQNKRLVEILLARGPEVDLETDHGATPLEQAVRNGNVEIAELLLRAGANPKRVLKDQGGRTLVHWAVEFQLQKLAELLLKHGADVNAKANADFTPLHSAVEQQNQPLVELLLAHKADVNAQDGAGETPLHYAVQTRRKPIIELLLKHQADINAKSKAGLTPLELLSGLQPIRAARPGSPQFPGRQSRPIIAVPSVEIGSNPPAKATELINLLREHGAMASLRRAWGPEQAVGAPDTFIAGDQRTAWASLGPDDGAEWLKLEYAKAVNVAEIRVRQNIGHGAIVKVTAFLENGQEVSLWESEEAAIAALDGIQESVFKVSSGLFSSKESTRSKIIKIYLDTRRVPSWNEIDAVELIGEDGSRQWAIQATASSTYADAQ